MPPGKPLQQIFMSLQIVLGKMLGGYGGGEEKGRNKTRKQGPLPSVSEELLGSHWRQQHPGLQGWHLASSQPGRAALQGQLLFCRMVGGGVISALPGTAG